MNCKKQITLIAAVLPLLLVSDMVAEVCAANKISFNVSADVTTTEVLNSATSDTQCYQYSFTTTDSFGLGIPNFINDTDTNYTFTKTNVVSSLDNLSVSADVGSVEENDSGLLTGDVAYTELRDGAEGTYIHETNTTADNLSALDTKIGTGKGVTGLYDATADVESQIQAVGNKTIQGITNAVSNGAGDTQKITVTTYDNTKMNIEIAGQGAVASGDVRLLNGDTVYNELRPTDGNYVTQSNTTADNLTALDTQVKTNADNIKINADNILDLENRVGSKLDSLAGEMNQIGAGAAALAALRPEPYDPDDRWSFAVGYGHYKNGNAAAMGVFFKPDENTTFSFGSTVWSGDPMLNFGASFKLGSRSPYAGTYRNTKKLIERVDAIEAGNAERDAIIAAQAKEIELLKADNVKIKAQLEEILSKLELSAM